MGNRASSPSSPIGRSSRGGSGASLADRQRSSSSHQAAERSSTSSSTITVNVDVDSSSSAAAAAAASATDEDDVYEGDSDEDQIQRAAGSRPQQQQQQQQEMSWYQMAKAGYQELVNAIIRPPRAQYDVEALGPTEFEFVGKSFKRIDFRLLNDRGHVLECSHWQPNGWRRAEQLPCVVYMHGNSSARVEALPQLSLALTLGATLVAFDFAGSGKSGGEHVSLGYYERDDLKAIIDHLRRSGQVSGIALWGRSMGAATALLHGDRDPSIAALVLDSAFADLTQLAEEMVERGRQAGLTVPGIVVKMVMRMIRGTVTKTANFNVRDLCPIKHADRTFIPALFVAGRADDFIKPHHSEQICEAYAGDKNFIQVEGDHNSPRPGFLFDSVYIFLQNYLQVPLEWGLDRENTVMGFPPWHYASGGGHGRDAAAAAALFGAASAARGDESGAFDPDFTDFDWDGIGLDDIGVDGNPSVGMTRARQAQFQTALFHVLAQERKEQAPAEVDGGRNRGRQPPAAAATSADGGAAVAVAAVAAAAVAAAAPAESPPPVWTDRRSDPPIASSLGSTATSSVLASSGAIEESFQGGGEGSSAKGFSSSYDAGAVVASRDGELLAGGALVVSREEQILMDEEQGAEAVAAVAAAVRATRTTAATTTTTTTTTTTATGGIREEAGATVHASCFPSSSFSLPPPPPPGGFATPNATARPTMAPFSVSDTSELDDLSPGDGPLRRAGRGGKAGSSSAGSGPVRFNSGGHDSVPEGLEGDNGEEEEGGVEGVTEFSAALGDVDCGSRKAKLDDSGKLGDSGDGAAASHAAPVVAAEGVVSRSASARSDGTDDNFFDAVEPALGEGDKLAGGGGGGFTSFKHHGQKGCVAGAGKEEEDERDSLSGNDVGGEWQQTAGLVAPPDGTGGLREVGESLAVDADTATWR